MGLNAFMTACQGIHCQALQQISFLYERYGVTTNAPA